MVMVEEQGKEQEVISDQCAVRQDGVFLSGSVGKAAIARVVLLCGWCGLKDVAVS